MRWNNPKLGVVSPDIFIPLLESTGYSVPIEEMVAQKPWDAAVLWPDDLSIAINYSALEICVPGLPERIKNNLNVSGLALHRFEIEITETTEIKDSGRALKNISELKDQGVRITLDDFGTKYANLDYLLKYPFDTIKIDKDYVVNIGQCSRSRKIIECIIRLAHSLGIVVLAEGVENQEQINKLIELGCDKVQGFYISPPVLPGDIPSLLKDYE